MDDTLPSERLLQELDDLRRQYSRLNNSVKFKEMISLYDTVQAQFRSIEKRLDKIEEILDNKDTSNNFHMRLLNLRDNVENINIFLSHFYKSYEYKSLKL